LLPSSQPSIEDVLERDEIQKVLSAVMGTLSEPNRLVMTLKMEGLNNSPIADFLDLPRDVVDTRLYRARKDVQDGVLSALEKGFPRLSDHFSETVYRQIQAYRLLTGVGLRFSDAHTKTERCTCAFRVKSLAELTGGAYHVFPGGGMGICYGINRVREDDPRIAVEAALKLGNQQCPAGAFALSVGQMIARPVGLAREHIDLCLRSLLKINGALAGIVVDSSIAWLFRREFGFVKIEQPGSPHPVYRLIRTHLSDRNTDTLVGRDAEIAQLEGAIKDLLAGQSGIIQLTGAAGIGKTHLLRTLRKRCEGKPTIWLEGKANLGRPHQPICEAIQSHFRFRSTAAVDHLHRALHHSQQANINDFPSWCYLGDIYRHLGQYEAMIDALEKAREQAKPLGDDWWHNAGLVASLVEGYACRGDWEGAYHYFWRMIDTMEERGMSLHRGGGVEEAVGAMCYGDKADCWMWEGIPQSIARARQLVAHLYKRGITPDDMVCWKALHPILAAEYVACSVESSHEEGVAMMRLFARQLEALDEYAAPWAYLSRILDRDTLEAIFKDILEGSHREASGNHSGTSVREKIVLEWLRASFRERHETDDVGRHLRNIGIVPEPCWSITGTFERKLPAEVSPEVEAEILAGVFNTSANLKWQTADTLIDGYIDCREIFQTTAAVSAYACTAIISPKETRALFSVYHDDSVRVWLNGALCFADGYWDYHTFEGTLQPGTNLVLIRVTNFEHGWGLTLRVTDREGKALDDLRFSRPRL